MYYMYMLIVDKYYLKNTASININDSQIFCFISSIQSCFKIFTGGAVLTKNDIRKATIEEIGKNNVIYLEKLINQELK